MRTRVGSATGNYVCDAFGLSVFFASVERSWLDVQFFGIGLYYAEFEGRVDIGVCVSRSASC